MIPTARSVLLFTVAAALVAGGAGLAAAASDRGAALAPDALLQRATATPGLRSYAVPAAFDVHLHRPLGVHSRVDGTIYYRAPLDAALVITQARGLIGRFFRGTYAIDLAPQVWPRKYVVTSMTSTRNALGPAYVLHARPKADPSIDAVTFTILKTTLEPLGATWHYTDGSTITLAITNRAVDRYRLPQSEAISLSLPRYTLDATATYGDYALNAPVPPGTFKELGAAAR